MSGINPNSGEGFPEKDIGRVAIVDEDIFGGEVGDQNSYH